MSRTIFVALCAVALFAMAPFARSESKTEFVPPENPVTDLYRAMTPNAMIPSITAEELTALAEKCSAQRDPHVTVKTCDDGIHEYWEYMWNAKGKEDECHVELTVTLVNGKVAGTMYLAKKGGDYPTKAVVGERPPTEPENPCLALWGDVKLGMTEEEFQAAATKHGLGGRPVSQNKMGEYAWERSWHHLPPQGAWQWQVILVVIFKDGCVSEAHHIPICYHSEEKK